MASKTLSNLVKFAAIAMAVCGLFIAAYILPSWGASLIAANSGFSEWYWPCLVFLWLTFIPCFVLLVFVWKVAVAIADETVFTIRTAKWIQSGGLLLLSAAGFFFVGNMLLFLLDMNHPGILLISLLGDMFVIALGVLAAVLSRYITKAAVLKEENEGTL